MYSVQVERVFQTDFDSQIVGDALVGVVFIRNGVAVAVLFGQSPWVDGMGIQNMFILTAVVGSVILLIPMILLKWGKRARMATAAKYQHHSRLY